MKAVESCVNSLDFTNIDAWLLLDADETVLGIVEETAGGTIVCAIENTLCDEIFEASGDGLTSDDSRYSSESLAKITPSIRRKSRMLKHRMEGLVK